MSNAKNKSKTAGIFFQHYSYMSGSYTFAFCIFDMTSSLRIAFSAF